MTLPAKLGKYEIRRELGRGAMGVVYEGWDAGIGRRVAIKTVKREQLDRKEVAEVLARFQREAQAAGRLTHPNIVSIYEFGEDAGAGEEDATAFIAMEFVDGSELKDHFDKDERFALPEVRRIMLELLDALGHAHKNGIVHRDIKPANVILLKDGTVKVADFGIARIESSNLTQAGAVLGTPSYMSPEQFMGQTVDGRSDLFSAGVILYQFLTGDKPFAGTITTIMHKVLKEEPIAPSELNVQVPRAFDDLMKKALAKRPEERFQTAREFADALSAAMVARASADATLMPGNSDATLMPGSADATLIPGAAAAAATAATPAPAPATAKPAAAPAAAPAATAPRVPLPVAAPPSSSAKWVLAGVAGIAVLAVGGYAALRSGGSPTEAPPQAAVAPAPNATAAAPAAAGAVRSDDLAITAVGYVDPADPRYAQDKGLMQADLREDARRQLIEKAIALYVQQESLTSNYELIRAKMLARSGEFIRTMTEEPATAAGKDGLIALTARGTVNVRQVQKSLNQMSREDRVEFIRNNGDPRISVAIGTRSAGADPAAPAVRSAAAENLLKERIQSFGFRVAGDGGGADFAVTGEAKFKKLSHTLEASGLTIEKYVLTSWSVKCADAKTNEEIYFNTQIPAGQSWATEDHALRDVGKLIGEEFSKNFFLQYFDFAAQKVGITMHGLPDADTAQRVLREFTSLRPVLGVALQRSLGSDVRFDAEISGGLGNPADLVNAGLLAPLNRKLGKTCLTVAAAKGSDVTVNFEPTCAAGETMARFDALPPASVLLAPPSRRDAMIHNPQTKRLVQI